MPNDPKPFEDLPLGMRTWIYENASDVAAALLCLMRDPELFRLCVATGMLHNLAKSGGNQ